MQNTLNKKWDIFISHASEDKETFVRDLAKKLRSFKIKVWYDEFTLKPGDSLVNSIDKGILDSEFGLIILSKNFFNKNWTDYEKRSLIATELGSQKRLIPIWLNISHNDVLNFSPHLADKFALQGNDENIDQIILQIIELVNPNVYSNIHRYIKHLKLISDTPILDIPISDLKQSTTIRHSKLNSDLLNRIKLIHFITSPYLPDSLDSVIEDFKQDMHPVREIIIWESICATFLEYIALYNVSDEITKLNIFVSVLSLSSLSNPTFKGLNEIQITNIKKLWIKNYSNADSPTKIFDV